MTTDVTLDRVNTLKELRESPTLVLACDGVVFDVTQGAEFYGARGPYASLARKDATRALAKMDLHMSDDDLALSSQGLTNEEKKTLQEWKAKFMKKYAVVGRLTRGTG